MPEYIQEVSKAFPGVLDAMEGIRNLGCINGTALLSTSFKADTVGGDRRPKVMDWAIHGGQPGGGMESRIGRGSDPIFLHVHLKKHLRWQCREKSPFLSATHSRGKPYRIASLYEHKGYENIHIIEFRLKKDDRHYLDDEFLIEHSIPAESTICRYSWKDDKTVLDRRGDIATGAVAELAERVKDRRAAKERELDDGGDGNRNGEPETRTFARKVGKRFKIGPKMGPNLGT
ncbi:hypothetical protein BKA67DRAFT_666796 [Truncatella angustata]|uniref:Uncharacterized protein n=1 Tax=Truncatella angustata TaxID=152316 RepID=A0A9P9A310_9PEZI|nr:uncharacterized protein BKA67DRAFT_666796 [Truncatella angustata]KAH6659972.1 hypothetical protein BKA67DRAFT_666796 [Truncatella angustata]